jgi:multiple sugar transport system ATP-binding protein
VLQQCDTPDNIYHLPANQFVATVVGSPPTNFIQARVIRSDAGLCAVHPAFTLAALGANHPLAAALGENGSLPAQAVVGIRPEDIQVLPGEAAHEAAPAGTAPATVSVIEPLGGETVVDLNLGPHTIKAVVPAGQPLTEGQPVWLHFDKERIHFFDVATGARRYTTGQNAGLECLAAMPA